MSKTRFFAAFLLWFALLLILWRLLPWVGSAWRSLLIGTGTLFGPVLHGWVLSPDGAAFAWQKGQARVPLSLQFDALGAALVPSFALLLATPGLPWLARLLRCTWASGLLFAIQASVVVLFPLLVFHKNAATDVLGVFLGMLSFVGAPAILWFLLTLDLQKQWLPGLRNKPQSRSSGND